MKTEAFEVWCQQRLLHISWMEKKTNADVRNIIGEQQTLMSEIYVCKLMYFGNNLDKAIMEGMVKVIVVGYS